MKHTRFLYTFFTFLLTLLMLGQQDPFQKEDLQKKSAALRQEISELNKTLATSKNKSQSSLEYIVNLNRKIEIRSQLIKNTRKESRFLDDDIYLSQRNINKLRSEFRKLREDYAEVLVRAYKNRSIQNKILFILSSENLSQAFRRIKYLQKYSEFQNRKVDEINEKQEAILKSIGINEKAKKDKLSLLVLQQQQIKNFNTERQEKQLIVDQFIKEQGDLAAQIKEKQRQKQALDNQVRAIITEEIKIAAAKKAAEEKRIREEEAARKKTLEEERARKAAEAEVAAKKLAVEKAEQARIAAEKALVAKREAEKEEADKIAARRAVETKRDAEKAAAEKIAAQKLATQKTAEAEKAEKAAEAKRESLGISSTPRITSSEVLTRSFESNRYSMSWPVNGPIILRYGVQPHPLLGGSVDSKGVEIAAASGSSAKAVFSGTVSRIIVIPGGGKAVLLNHGDYFTLYANLSSVSVSVGSNVNSGQAVGKIYTDDGNNTILNFQIWRGTVPQNPANWFSGM